MLCIVLFISSLSMMSGAHANDYCKIHPFHTLCNYVDRVKVDCLGYEFGDNEDHYMEEMRLNEQEKEDIMQGHNRLRSMVARGWLHSDDKAPYMYLPQAEAMYELIWDDELEKSAQAHADRCLNVKFDVNRDVRRFQVGQNIYSVCYTRTTNNWTVDEMLDIWAETRYNLNQERFYGFSPRLEYLSNMRLITFAQMIWGSINYIGCARAVFNGKLPVQPPQKDKGKIEVEVWVHQYVCNYGPGGMEMRMPIYNVGKTASKCCQEKSKTYDGLCLPCQ